MNTRYFRVLDTMIANPIPIQTNASSQTVLHGVQGQGGICYKDVLGERADVVHAVDADPDESKCTGKEPSKASELNQRPGHVSQP